MSPTPSAGRVTPGDLARAGGHGVLFDHINRGSFQFCHSAGDALSAIRHDPDSHAPDRGRYAPWNPINLRRVDRELADGWGWGGPHDDRNYGTEEIMSSTLFRAYRAIGGDSPDLSRRQFASGMMQWLILQTIGKFTEAANPLNAQEFAEAMIWADEDNWTIGGADGPCYGKVVRWAFEKQGLYAAQPPDVDVYIDDGRHGEYTYLTVSWKTRRSGTGAMRRRHGARAGRPWCRELYLCQNQEPRLAEGPERAGAWLPLQAPGRRAVAARPAADDDGGADCGHAGPAQRRGKDRRAVCVDAKQQHVGP